MSRTAAAVAGALLLSSCGATGPGVAASVEGDEITEEQVDGFAKVLCSLDGALPITASGTPTSQARYRSLQILIANELAAEVADVEGADPAGVDAIMQQLAAQRESVPESLRDTFDDVALEFARAETAIAELGSESLADRGKPAEVGSQRAYAEGERLRAEYAATADIEIDPRFGTLEDGVLLPADGSLSVPVSDEAVDAADPELVDDHVGQLPASQKCG